VLVTGVQTCALPIFLLCKDKDSEVVEYALSRSLSPTMILEYKTQLPDKYLLQQKLHELFNKEIPEN
jgi:hypothetical protein